MSLFVQNGDAVGIDVTYLMCHRGEKKKNNKTFHDCSVSAVKREVISSKDNFCP